MIRPERVEQWLEEHDDTGALTDAYNEGMEHRSRNARRLVEALLERTDPGPDERLESFEHLVARNIHEDTFHLLDRIAEQRPLHDSTLAFLHSTWSIARDEPQSRYGPSGHARRREGTLRLLDIHLAEPDTRFSPETLLDLVRAPPDTGILRHIKEDSTRTPEPLRTALERLLDHPDTGAREKRSVARARGEYWIRKRLVEDGELLTTQQGRNLLAESRGQEVLSAVVQAAPDGSGEEQTLWGQLLRAHPDEALRLVEEGAVAILERTARRFEDDNDLAVRQVARWVLGEGPRPT